MDCKNLEKQMIRKQNLYIRQLEEQLAVYEEKDRAQELLIEELNRALQLFADGVSDKKAGEKGKDRTHEWPAVFPDSFIIIPAESGRAGTGSFPLR